MCSILLAWGNLLSRWPIHRRMGTLWLGGAEGLICPKFYTDNHKHPPPLGHCPRDVIHPPKIWKTPLLLDIHKHPPPLGHCLCDVIINIPKGLICSFLWPIFSSCFARISPTVFPNFTRCLPEFGGAAAPPPAPPASYAYGPISYYLPGPPSWMLPTPVHPLQYLQKSLSCKLKPVKKTFII